MLQEGRRMSISTGGRRLAAMRAHPWSLTAVAAFISFATWLVVRSPDAGARRVAGDLVPLGFEVIVVLLALSCGRRAQASRCRWAWRLIAAAFGLYLLGDSVWALFELVQNRSPFPSIADAFYLAFYPVLLGGLLLLPGPLRRRSEWRRLSLDVVTVTIAGAMAVWYLVIGPTLEQGSGTLLSTTLSLSYPVGDLVLVFGIATVIVRGVQSDGAVVARWMALGATAFVVADIGFANLNLTGGYAAGSWPDLGWLCALMCFVVAAEVERHRPVSGARPDRQVTHSRVSPLPYVAIASSFALLIYVGFSQAGATVRTLLLLIFALTATVVARQITAVRDSARITDQFQRLATTDPLTSLPNRRHLIDAAEREFTEAQRHGDDLAVIFIDVDHFKSINDVHGHAVGDAVLIWLGERLRSSSRESDLVGRFGGDEFVVIVGGLDEGAVLSIATRLERSVAAASRPVEHGPEGITLSLGVATSRGCSDLDDLLARADAALYRAKRSGRSRACLVDPGDALVDL